MKEFFNKYLYDSVKLLVDQVAFALFGLAMAMATLVAANKNPTLLWLKWTSAVGSVLFYLIIIYLAIWPIGSKDRMSADYNRIPKRPYLGLAIGAVASIPNAVLFLFIALGKAVPFLSGFGNTCQIISMFFQGAYAGLFSCLSINGSYFISTWWAYGLAILPVIVTSYLGYLAGYYNFRIFPYKQNVE